MNKTLIVKIKKKLALNVRFDTAHWRSKWGNPKHGPQVWPWWHLFSLSLVTLEVWAPTTGKRLWFYTRWGALYLDVVFDRRGVVQKRVQVL